MMKDTCKELGCLLAVTLVAALVAGGFCTCVQQAQAIQLIVDAEAYEVMEVPGNGTQLDTPMAASAEPEQWFPADGAPRHICTFVSNMVVMWGFSIILLAIFVLRNKPVGINKATYDLRATLWGGICWGSCGFVVFGIAPSLNLPPELPGMVAAELEKRQGCWAYTAAFTFLGLVGLYFGEMTRGPKVSGYFIGVIFLILPHAIGGPDYDHMVGGADRPPPELAAKFAMAALVAQALSWVFLGIVSAIGFNMYFLRYGRVQDAAPMVSASDPDTKPSVVGSSGNPESLRSGGLVAGTGSSERNDGLEAL